MQLLHQICRKALRAENAGWVDDVIDAYGEVRSSFRENRSSMLCVTLKETHGFDMLADLCGADRGPEEDPRFVVNYHLFSTKHHNRLRLKVRVSEDDPHVQTVTQIWRTADWHERETYDCSASFLTDIRTCAVFFCRPILTATH